jgi:prepilin-type N-terminal cleavage/methylation domain-containing protein
VISKEDHMKRILKTETGFTLVELIIAVTVLGIVSIIMSPALQMLSMTQHNAYIQQQKMLNNKIAKGLLNYAEEETQLGEIPTAYTGDGYASTVYDSTKTTIKDHIVGMDVPEETINSDTTPGKKERVYSISNETIKIPFYGNTGPSINVKYQVANLYLSICLKDDASCDPKLPANNNVDATTVKFSTLPLQKKKLTKTRDSLQLLRTHMVDYFRAKQQLAAAGDPTNFFPDPTSIGATSKATGTAIQKCHNGWYSMAQTYSGKSIAGMLGLSTDDVGKTSWGGLVEYCRDYAPAGGAANTPPHYAAIRVLKDLSSGNDPNITAGGANQNIFISF